MGTCTTVAYESPKGTAIDSSSGAMELILGVAVEVTLSMISLIAKSCRKQNRTTKSLAFGKNSPGFWTVEGSWLSDQRWL